MSAPALSAEQMLAWNEQTSSRWHALLEQHPHALALHCDVMNTTDAAGLVHHINVVELRYAQRIAGVPETSFDEVGKDLKSSYDAHHRAIKILRTLLDTPGFDWKQSLEFNTMTLGRIASHRDTVFIHAMLHSIRHYGQLATLVRQNGIKPGWPMDYLPMDATQLGPNR